MTQFQKLLIVEDTPSLARTYEAHLRGHFESIEIVETGAAAAISVEAETPSCVLLDLKLPDADGLDLLQTWVGDGASFPIVVITANGSMGVAVEAMKQGAADFIVKPTSRDRLRQTIEIVMREAQIVTRRAAEPVVEAPAPKSDGDDRSEFCGFIGRSFPMQAVYKTIESAAPSRANVFVTGETGTGKELAARAVHLMSPRRSAKFVPINCGAIPSDLIESELFGHVKGAFTGATTDRIGAAQLADGGTLFLDELGEMPINLQPKLLRFIQTGEFSRVGESKAQKADIRIVAATNRNPLLAVQEGRLREDLYYRLYVIPVALPGLRERSGDILILARAFLQRYGYEERKQFDGFDRSAEQWLVDQPWPGNVRQLENLMRQIAVLVPGGIVSATTLAQLMPRTDHVPSPNLAQPTAMVSPAQPYSQPGIIAPIAPAPADPGVEPLWLTEKKAIERAVALCDGNVTAAAKLLELSPSTIYRKREAWQANEAV